MGFENRKIRVSDAIKPIIEIFSPHEFAMTRKREWKTKTNWHLLILEMIIIIIIIIILIIIIIIMMNLQDDVCSLDDNE